jgi:glycosyltransferase involved in cell wall biosynthesis
VRVIFSCASVRIGGTSTFALGLADGLRHLGHEPIALVHQRYGTLLPEFRQAFSHVQFVPRYMEGRRAYLRRLYRLICKFNPDAVINNAVPATQALFPYLPVQTKRISVLHSIARNELVEGTACEPWITRVVAVSPSIVQASAELIDRSRIGLIPVGVPLGEHTCQPRQQADPLKIAYVGRLTKVAKNVDALPRILDQLANRHVPFELTIVGSGEYEDELRMAFGRRPYRDQVRFTGPQTPAAVREILRSQHTLLMCSTYEGTPHALLEAMATGLVCIVPHLSGATDCIISQGKTGFLCSTRGESGYADLLEMVYRNPVGCVAVGMEARATVRARYSVEMMTQQYLAVLRETSLCSIVPRPNREIGDMIDNNLRSGLPGRFRYTVMLIGRLLRYLKRGSDSVRPAMY